MSSSTTTKTTAPTTTAAPTADDVRSAADVLRGVAHETPVVTSRRLDAELGCEVFLKCENLQRVGAFKFRGAYNALSRFDAWQRRAGVVAFSSGNHAQAIALAAQLLDIPAAIVMPHDAPASKLAATRGYGAEVIGYDRVREDREAIGAALAEERGMTLIPPYDHPDVIAGQGTVALELHRQVPDLDVLLVPLGGGGLLSGCVLATQDVAPGCRVIGVEPAAGDDGRRSLQAGKIVHIDTPDTIADGARTQHLGGYTFPIIRGGVPEIMVATDNQLRAGVRTLALTTKLVVEPTGVLAYAALAADPAPFAGKRVGVVLSGGNVDADVLAGILAPE